MPLLQRGMNNHYFYEILDFYPIDLKIDFSMNKSFLLLQLITQIFLIGTYKKRVLVLQTSKAQVGTMGYIAIELNSNNVELKVSTSTWWVVVMRVTWQFPSFLLQNA